MAAVAAPTNLLINSSYIGKTLEFVKSAKSRIWIYAYTWRWYGHSPEIPMQQLNMAILAASKRGVDVKAITYFSDQQALLKSLGLNVRTLNSLQTMHAKAVAIDSKTLILGSHNLTKKGTEDNLEVSLATQELEPVLQFERYFQGVWDNLTK